MMTADKPTKAKGAAPAPDSCLRTLRNELRSSEPEYFLVVLGLVVLGLVVLGLVVLGLVVFFAA